MIYKVLLVDDDENILQGYYRNLRRQFSLEIALGGESALQALEHHGPFAVLVSDMRMPGMSGLDLLKTVKQQWPDIIRIMLTGNADQGTAMDAVNQGEVFRFLTKPCDSDHMTMAIAAGLRQFHLVQAEKILLERTLMGSVRVLTDLLSLMDPETHGHSQLIRERALLVGKTLGFEEPWSLEVAAMLAPIGRTILPKSLVSKLGEHQPLNPAEQALADRIPEFGARLLGSIPRLENVAEMIRCQDKSFAAEGQGPCGLELPLGARILKAVADFTNRERVRKDARVVLEDMKLHQDSYDPEVLKQLECLFVNSPHANGAVKAEVSMPSHELYTGLILSRNAQTQSGQVILPAGARLGSPHLEMLKALHELGELEEPVHVLGR